jgi:hypothetical protein
MQIILSICGVNPLVPRERGSDRSAFGGFSSTRVLYKKIYGVNRPCMVHDPEIFDKKNIFDG